MKILFTICGRAGSKGLKNKNLKEFLGYPLPFYTVSVIDLWMKRHENTYCDIILNTDSEELINLFMNNIKVKVEYLRRRPELGGDTVPKIMVISESYEFMKRRVQRDYDMIIDLDITAPLRTLKDLENLVEKKSQTNADVVFSVTHPRRNPYFNMVIDSEKGVRRVIDSNFNARQEAPVLYDMNASMYAYSGQFLSSGQGIFDGHCEIIQMKDTAVLDIDSEEDFQLMEVVGAHFFRSIDFAEVKAHINKII